MLSITSRSSVQAARPAATPRAFGHLQTSLLRRAGDTLWCALQRVGQERASRELRRLAIRWQARDPALSEQLLEASRFDVIGNAAISATAHGLRPVPNAAVPRAA